MFGLVFVSILLLLWNINFMEWYFVILMYFYVDTLSAIKILICEKLVYIGVDNLVFAYSLKVYIITMFNLILCLRRIRCC